MKKKFLALVLTLAMVLSLAPVGALAADETTTEKSPAVTQPAAEDENQQAVVDTENTTVLAAAAEPPAEGENALTAVPEDKLIFDKTKGEIKRIDAAWLAEEEHKDKPLSVTIPAEIGGVKVTSIGSQAFLYNGKVVSADLSKAAITEIGDNAFDGCSSLEKVAFPDTLTKIGNQAFNNNKKLASVDLSKTKVATIGRFAFGDCTSLKDVILPSTLTELGSSVFTDCEFVESIRLADSPEGVVFALPEGLTSIGYQCFKNCFAADVNAKVVIPASVTTINGEAFKDIHITQIIFKKTVDPWEDEDYSGYDNSAMTPPNGCDRIIVLPDNKCFVAYSEQVGYDSNLQKICTYPIKITFSPLGRQEQHLNHARLGWAYNSTTKLWDFNNNYKLPDTNGATTGGDRPGYEYVGGWKLRSSDQVLNENEKLEAKDNPSDFATVSGEYKLANPTISYLVDGKSKQVDADQPFTVTIGDGKEHTLGVQVSHPLLLSEQGNKKGEYVYFEYCWWDEGYFADNGTTMTVNGLRSTEEPNLFSKAGTDRELHRVWVTDNTIPITKIDHARTDHNYYLVEICGYIVKDGGDPVRFYQSSNNFIRFGFGENVATVKNYYTLQVNVNEVRIITATAGDNGKITPAGDVAVPLNGSQTFTITPNDGYHIQDVKVDRESVGAVKEYTFKDVTASHTIYATFARNSSGGGSRPTVTIPDDVPTGLNGKDHYAYVVGYPDGMVYPQKNITRAEVATIFFRLLKDETREANMTKSNSYNDMKDGAWYTCAVSTLSKMGIIKGYEDGSFKPDASISRAEFAAIAARFDPDGDKTPATFSDVSSHWAKDEISIAANHGWIKGYEDGSFKPDQKITRAETMTLVNRVLKRLPETKDDLHKDMKTWPDNQNESAWFYLAVQEATNSHYQKLKKDGTHEKWESMRETRDWAALEK